MRKGETVKQIVYAEMHTRWSLRDMNEGPHTARLEAFVTRLVEKQGPEQDTIYIDPYLMGPCHLTDVFHFRTATDWNSGYTFFDIVGTYEKDEGYFAKIEVHPFVLTLNELPPFDQLEKAKDEKRALWIRAYLPNGNGYPIQLLPLEIHVLSDTVYRLWGKTGEAESWNRSLKIYITKSEKSGPKYYLYPSLPDISPLPPRQP